MVLALFTVGLTIGNYIPLVAMLATVASNLAKLIPGITPVGIKMGISYCVHL
ncbi:MAG: hypothetical protein ACLUKO_14140 [Enterocloster bolteae]